MESGEDWKTVESSRRAEESREKTVKTASVETVEKVKTARKDCRKQD